MKHGLFDIECTNLRADFGYILCAGVKEWGGGPATILRLDDYRTFETRPWEDKRLVKDYVKLLSEYDVLISWNGKRFDWPFVRTRMMLNGYDAPTNQKHIDLYFQARFKLQLSTNKLGHVGEMLGCRTEKTQHEGWRWVQAAHGVRSQMDWLVDHNRRDLLLLEEVGDKLKQLVRVIHD